MADKAGTTSEATGVLVVCASMESAGSGWLFNLVNDLLGAAAGDDVREIRDRFELDDVLRWHNCNVGELNERAWQRLQAPLRAGHTFVVKTHRPPNPLMKRLQQDGRLTSLYIHRDPRDVVVSAYQRGKGLRANGRYNSFGRLVTIDVSIAWMRWKQLRTYEAWRRHPGVCMVRYEDLMADPTEVLSGVAQHVGVDVSAESIAQLIDRYEGENSRGQSGTHFRGGGRRQDALSKRQLWTCNRLFADALRSMGYES